MIQFINKYFSKTNNRLLSIILGIGVIIFYFIANSIARAIGALSTDSITMFVILFLIMYIIYILTTGISLYYSYQLYFKNNDKDINNIITLVVASITALILLLNIQSVLFFFKLSSIDSIYEVLSLAGDIEDVTTALRLLDFAFIILIGNAIYNGFLYFTQDHNKIDPTNVTSDKQSTPADSNTTKIEKEPNQILIKVKTFLSTRKGKMITGGIAAAIVLVAIFTTIMGNQKTEIDIMKNVEISFSGMSGEGYAEIENSSFDYDGDNEKIEDFLDSIYFHVKRNNGELKNGDTVKVEAIFDEGEATSSKVAIKTKTKTFKVKGLDTNYESSKDIQNDQKKKLAKSWDTYFKDSIDDELLEKVEYEFKDEPAPVIDKKVLLNTYFADSEYASSDKVVYLVKATTSGKKRYSFSDGPEDIVLSKYYIIEIDGVTKSKIDKLKNGDYEFYYKDIEADNDDSAREKLLKQYSDDFYSEYELSEIK